MLVDEQGAHDLSICGISVEDERTEDTYVHISLKASVWPGPRMAPGPRSRIVIRFPCRERGLRVNRSSGVCNMRRHRPAIVRPWRSSSNKAGLELKMKCVYELSTTCSDSMVKLGIREQLPSNTHVNQPGQEIYLTSPPHSRRPGGPTNTYDVQRVVRPRASATMREVRRMMSSTASVAG